MKTKITIIAIFVSLLSYSQASKLTGTWILDKTVFQDGSILEIDNLDFSKYSQYEFYGNKMVIDGMEIPVTITENTIETKALKIFYELRDNYLLLQHENDNKIMLFLKPETFLLKYPEFKNSEKIVSGKSVVEENEIFRAEFKIIGGFNKYLAGFIQRYDNYPQFLNYFKVQFILTPENRIENINVIQGISKDFDKKITQYILESEKYFQNKTGTNLLFSRSFTQNRYINFERGNISKEEKQFIEQSEKISKLISDQDIEKADIELEKFDIFALNKEIYKSASEPLHRKLGIAYLSKYRFEKACQNFEKAGGITNFSVRNYIINFCKK